MKHSKIEKAIVLSLLLSSSLYGTVSAADVQVLKNDDPILVHGDYEYIDGDNKDIKIEHIQDNNYELENHGIAYGIWVRGSEHELQNDAYLKMDNINNLAIEVSNFPKYLIHDTSISAGIFVGASDYNGNSNRDAKIEISANGNATITAETTNDKDSYGILAKENGEVDLNAKNITINSQKTMVGLHNIIGWGDIPDVAYENSNVYGIKTEQGTVNLGAKGNIVITTSIDDNDALNKYDNYQYYKEKLEQGDLYSVNNKKGTVKLVGNNINLEATAKKGNAYGIYSENAVNNYLNAKDTINITATSDSGNAYGIYSKNDNAVGKNALGNIDAKNMTIVAKSSNGEAKAIVADNESVNENIDEVLYIQASTGEKGLSAVGIEAKNNGNVSIVNEGNLSFSSNCIEALGTGSFGIKNDNSTVSLEAKNGGWNIIRSEAEGNQGNAISTTGENAITDIKGNVNQITAGKLVDGQYYDGTAINATDGSKVNIQADEFNYIGGTVCSAGDDTVVNLGTYDENGFNHGGSNYIVSNGHGKSTEQNHIVSAVYAQGNGIVNIGADNEHINYIATKTNEYPEGSEQDKEKAVWAEQGTINLYGKTIIETTNGSIEKPNNVGIAIAAGGVEGADVNAPHDAFVNANLNNGSYIFGDILAGAKGQVD